MSQFDFKTLLASAVDSCSEATPRDKLLPWESGVFKQIFDGEDPLSWKDRFDLPDPPGWDQGETESLFPAEKKRKVLDSDFCFTVVRKTEGLSWEDQRQQDSDKAMARWIFIIVKWSETCPDLLVCQSLSECTEKDQRINVIQDWLHPKAPSTLLKRANSIMGYHKVVGWGDGTFPYREQDVYRYMSDAKAGGAKPSQLKALQEAVIFVRHIFMVPQLDRVIESRRCLGASQRGTVKRGKKRAHPLSILELRKLHHLLANKGVSAWDRTFAGAVLCCTYMRARWGNFQHTVSFDIETNDRGDVIFLVYTAEVYKTVNSKYFSGEPVRFIAPGVGILSDNWLHLWKQARAEVGLFSFLPPLPTPNAAGEAMGCSVSSSEIRAWVQKVLGRDNSLNTTGHLMKRTFLTMAAKRGIEHLDRLAMGGHANSAKMADTYGDDELARPLRLLLALLEEIREGIFDPDAGRAGYILGAGLRERRLEADRMESQGPPAAGAFMAVATPEVVDGDCPADQSANSRDSLTEQDAASWELPHPEPLNDDDWRDLGISPPSPQHSAAYEGPNIEDSLVHPWDNLIEGHGGDASETDSSSSSCSEDSSSSSSRVSHEPERKVGVPRPAAGTSFLQHKRTRLLHMISDQNRKVLLCGRMVGDIYKPPSKIRFDSSVCRNCKKFAADL
ncbi:unnamed protein product [Symbiodinium sp. CCMP2592]|nr:unnamed protein product [Symbiodinium sp. CCMP2592]